MSGFLDRSISAHVGWKAKLAAGIEGRAPLPEERVIAADNQCDLGKWIHGDGAALGALPEYKRLRDRHAQFHQAAAGVVRLANTGDKVKAAQALHATSQYGKASTDVVAALKMLKDKLPK